MSPDLSAIIVNWNTRDLLLECVRSIKRTAGRVSVEIIVVDNASSDDSCEALEREFPDVRLLRNEKNEGFAKANNRGIRHSEGRCVALINSDIEVLDGCFAGLVDAMERDPRVGIAGPKILNPDRSYQLSCRNAPSLWNNFIEALGIHTIFPRNPWLCGEFLLYDRVDHPLSVDILSGCFLCVTREALEQLGGLDEEFFFYGEDKEFCIRYGRRGWRIMYVPAAGAIHYGGASAAKKPDVFQEQLLRAKLQFVGKLYHPLTFPLFVLEFALFSAVRIVKFAALSIARSVSPENARPEIRAAIRSLQWLRRNGWPVLLGAYRNRKVPS